MYLKRYAAAMAAVVLCLAPLGPSAFAQAQTGGVADGPRLPGDYPLPPVDFMLDPHGRPPNGAPPDTSDALGPSPAQAAEAAQAALSSCAAQGLEVGVAILKADGDLRLASSTAKMPPGRIYTAIRKGLAAIAFGVPTSQIRGLVAADPSQAKLIRPGMALFGGAVPLIAGGKVYGAVAVSGAQTDQDEHCAAVGAQRIAGELSPQIPH